ncbi:MAG: DUF3570 domain-containing protein [Bacteroidota bacterium]
MRYYLLISILVLSVSLSAQDNQEFKKSVLEKTEVDLLMSYYTQDGSNSSVGGGIGTEKLKNGTPTIVLTLPLNADDVLTIDAGLSAYSSASSSNLNPFVSGASNGEDEEDEEDEEDDDKGIVAQDIITGTPWYASSGASKEDVLGTFSVNYEHSSDNRNNTWSAHGSFSTEYDYTSFGFGAGFSKLFNQKNTEIGLKANVYLDQWRPEYPTELKTFVEVEGDLNDGFFEDATIWHEDVNNPNLSYNPNKFNTIDQTERNSYSASFSFSQILSKKLQTSVFFDVVHQQGLLSTPYHRIYFSDTENFYIGNSASYFQEQIPYDKPQNKDYFMLADDIERLPNTRLKIPIGIRLHYYINEFLTLRNYYRYYWDDWGIVAHTYSIEIPVKIGKGFTLYPNYRYYTQNEARYFAPFNTHVSTETYYTSDYDLSQFQSNQYGIALKYIDLLSKLKLWKIALKSIDVRYSHYDRTTGLNADIVTAGMKFIVD